MAKRSKSNKRSPWMRDAHTPEIPLWESGSSPLALWRDGVGFPLILAALALFPLVSGHFEMPTRERKLILDGWAARALGIAVIAFGACLHFHNFWGMTEKLADFSPSATFAGALVFVGAVASIGYFALF